MKRPREILQASEVQTGLPLFRNEVGLSGGAGHLLELLGAAGLVPAVLDRLIARTTVHQPLHRSLAVVVEERHRDPFGLARRSDVRVHGLTWSGLPCLVTLEFKVNDLLSQSQAEGEAAAADLLLVVGLDSVHGIEASAATFFVTYEQLAHAVRAVTQDPVHHYLAARLAADAATLACPLRLARTTLLHAARSPRAQLALRAAGVEIEPERTARTHTLNLWAGGVRLLVVDEQAPVEGEVYAELAATMHAAGPVVQSRLLISQPVDAERQQDEHGYDGRVLDLWSARCVQAAVAGLPGEVILTGGGTMSAPDRRHLAKTYGLGRDRLVGYTMPHYTGLGIGRSVPARPADVEDLIVGTAAVLAALVAAVPAPPLPTPQQCVA
jgi:hypothetical protein